MIACSGYSMFNFILLCSITRYSTNLRKFFMANIANVSQFALVADLIDSFKNFCVDKRPGSGRVLSNDVSHNQQQSTQLLRGDDNKVWNITGYKNHISSNYRNPFVHRVSCDHCPILL